jgi:hypothetical protein
MGVSEFQWIGPSVLEIVSSESAGDNDMMSRNLSRRLERLEASLMPTSGPRLMVINVIATATEEVTERITMPWDDDPHYRRRRTTTGSGVEMESRDCFDTRSVAGPASATESHHRGLKKSSIPG